MKISLTLNDRLGLRFGSLYARWGDVRARCVILLHLGRGTPISRISRSCGISRPTLYKYAVVYLAHRRISDLRTEGIGNRYRASLIKMAGELGPCEEADALIERARRGRS